jgi:hypothetical protein
MQHVTYTQGKIKFQVAPLGMIFVLEGKLDCIDLVKLRISRGK